LSVPTEPIVVRENEVSEPVRLTVPQRDDLEGSAPEISVRPVPGREDLYTLNPGNMVGAIQLDDLRFELRPKLAIKRLLFLLSYSLDPDHWHDQDFSFEEEPELFEAVAHGFASQLERTLLGGRLQGYRFEEQALQTIRGRIMFDEHIRSRFGLIPPIECGFDEFTDDIEINRLLKAAILRLGEIRLRSPSTRRRLRTLLTHFASVSTVRYDPRAIPVIEFDRRTERYRGPVNLARLILASRSFDSRSGNVKSAAFLLNMATVFENFVVIALREEMALGDRDLVQHAAGKNLHLDAARSLRLKPDLSWWEGSRCLFVGDVKYKRTRPVSGIQHPDVYQLLAYTVATQRPRGLLVYAASDEYAESKKIMDGAHRIADADKILVVKALDLGVPPDEVLDQVRDLAEEIRRQAAEPAHQLARPLAYAGAG
jgi:5-methylcytosine-specific restriction enzyme subunit McrC